MATSLPGVLLQSLLKAAVGSVRGSEPEIICCPELTIWSRRFAQDPCNGLRLIVGDPKWPAPRINRIPCIVEPDGGHARPVMMDEHLLDGFRIEAITVVAQLGVDCVRGGLERVPHEVDQHLTTDLEHDSQQ
ncbi:MAG: hypothetical protein ACYTF5_12590 [Planctomycetota bacterium]|jgi:hypothetical protein